MPRANRKPPLKLRRQMQLLIDACRKAIIKAPVQTGGSKDAHKAIAVDVVWGDKEKPPKFPRGIVLGVKTRYNAVKLLKWFQDNNYITYNAKDLFAERKAALLGVVRWMYWLEKDLDVSQFDVYNERIEIEED